MDSRPVRVLLLLLVVGFFALFATQFQPQHVNAQGSAEQGVRPMGSLWNAPAPAISSSLFATSLVPSTKTSAMRISVTLKVTGILYLAESNGTTTQVFALNGGSALTAFQGYTFVWGMRNKDEATPANPLTYNFQLGTNGGVAVLRCDEVLGNAD